jgi:hypothetical protein
MCIPVKLIRNDIYNLFAAEMLEKTLSLVEADNYDLSEFEILGNLLYSNYNEFMMFQNKPFSWTRLGQMIEPDTIINNFLKQHYYQYASYECTTFKNSKSKSYFYLLKERLIGLI